MHAFLRSRVKSRQEASKNSIVAARQIYDAINHKTTFVNWRQRFEETKKLIEGAFELVTQIDRGHLY